MKMVWIAVTRQKTRGTDFPEIVEVEVFDTMKGAERFCQDFLGRTEEDHWVAKSAIFEHKEVWS